MRDLCTSAGGSDFKSLFLASTNTPIGSSSRGKSINKTLFPAFAIWAAIPLPMVPAPITAICLNSGMF